MATALIDEPADGFQGRSAIGKLFDDTRRRLVETGTRNRLIHVNRANTRGHVINIVNERSDQIYRILSSGRAMRYLAIGRDKEVPDEGELLADIDDDDFDEGRLTDVHLETRLGPETLQNKLLKIAREARTAEEEQGVNILYLALGFLKWFEDEKSGVPREAPLILLPVELVRNARTSAYDVKLREDEIMTNLPLQQRLKEDFGIALPEIEVDEDWTPSAYFEQVEAAVMPRNRWKVDRDGVQLGFFSFSKLLMYLDLALDAWPADMLATHDLTKGLLYEGFEAEPPLFGSGARLDNLLPPEELFHVIDADASQAKVIEEVRTGRNLVVQGPPGTGKSQTITNIIAAAVKDGKRVLFVAEKMAALSVVHERLVKVGLSDVCLELHSRTANKKAVLLELARTLSAAADSPSMPPAPAELRMARDRLNEIADLIHHPLDTTGETPFSVLALQSRFMGAGLPPPWLDGAALTRISRQEEQMLLERVERFGRLVAEGETSGPHPFDGVRNFDVQPVEVARLAPQLRDASVAAGEAAAAISKAARLFAVDAPTCLASATQLLDLMHRVEGCPSGSLPAARLILAAGDIGRLREGLQAGASWRAKRDAAEQLFVEGAFTVAATPLRGPIVAGTRSFFVRLGGAYRGASRQLAGLLRQALPKAASDRLQLLDLLEEVAAAARLWEADREYCARVLADHWRGERTDFVGLETIVSWCEDVRSAALQALDDALLAAASNLPELMAIRHALAELSPAARQKMAQLRHLLDIREGPLAADAAEASELAVMQDRLNAMAATTDEYAGWARVARLRLQLSDAGIAEIADRMAKREMAVPAAITEIRFARAEALWRVALERFPALRQLASEDRHELVATFARLERDRLKENVTCVLSAHLSQVPQGALGEMKVIRGEIAKKKSHMALRRLFTRAGTAIQRIKPVLLMSPISVAQFLPPGTLRFDLLVIDEASQVRPEDALGAIARSSQIVVVGDQKQLPPTSFFDRLLADEGNQEEEDEEDRGEDLLDGAATLASAESVLSLCEARGLSSRMLQWHYRSRDPSLITVSNREFYDSELILPPSPLQRDPAFGLCFRRVNGAYDMGGKRDNRIEGEAIVARVAEHARETPDVSLGVVTFSSAQKNLINQLLETARRADRVLDDFLREGRHEDLFVKNIETVQGDERDVILVSVGYGPQMPGGRLASMSFGPVNGEGGERRLNVLFTRARLRCEVFASFDPADIDVARVSRDGPRILKRFLQFAKDGRQEEGVPLGVEAESPFEEDVADVVRALGFIADPQIGSAGFRIDLGVRHPDRPGAYILAVECDGATYHGALWARERDRLREDVLKNLGWRFHRVWSTDWFYNRLGEIERLRQALEQARDASEQGVRLVGANHGSGAAIAPSEQLPSSFILPEVVARQMPAYKKALFEVETAEEPHQVPRPVLAALALQIVAVEGPIHVGEVARRIAACFGKDKAGSRIVAAASAALTTAQNLEPDLLTDGMFWFTRDQANSPPVRDRSAESGTILKAASISMLEIEAALDISRADNAGGEDAELIRTAARLLGFRRVGPDLQARLALALAK